VDPSEPLATLDPADRPAAKAETSAPEAAAWLATPADAPPPFRLTFFEWLAQQPEWIGPLPDCNEEDDDPPGPNLLDLAYTQYRREMLAEFLGHQVTDPATERNPQP
jgi:hypothetical protein